MVVAGSGSKVTLSLVIDDCSTTPAVTATLVAAKLPASSRSTNVLGISSGVPATTVV